MIELTGADGSRPTACSTKQSPSVAPAVGDPGAEALNLNDTDIADDAQKVPPLYQMAAHCRLPENEDRVSAAYAGNSCTPPLDAPATTQSGLSVPTTIGTLTAHHGGSTSSSSSHNDDDARILVRPLLEGVGGREQARRASADASRGQWNSRQRLTARAWQTGT